MKARFAGLLAAVCVGTAISPAQIKMDLRDVSDDDCPVRISGTVSFEDDASQAIRYTYRTNGSITNVSDRGILITVIHLDMTGLNPPALNINYEIDRFYGPEVLEPGKAEDLYDMSPAQFGAPIFEREVVPEDGDPDTSSTATGEVIFVQFIDGTVWGDIDSGGFNSGRMLLVSRNHTLHELQKLERIFNEHADEAFKDELLKADSGPVEFPAVSALIHKCRNAATSCLITGLQLMLEAAAAHGDEMKKSGHASESGIVPE